MPKSAPAIKMKNETVHNLPRLAYSVEEVAHMLNVSEKTVYRLVNRKLLKATKALRHLRITAASIESFLCTTTE